ncbi:TonB-dependent siderophore receptor [Adhaeribacter arboris]|uniref:TonB-dependent siderophore receptor n=1 Tax=Adhaeribacter arboris TaxID=2072846 RepID=A0A2T2YEP2_9BACT|nr:TonB-dependent receptor [Adhaeribacter arboris]PSR53972.1 TonB-dependent siderophore receptor [Adhaeribacter arboris]
MIHLDHLPKRLKIGLLVVLLSFIQKFTATAQEFAYLGESAGNGVIKGSITSTDGNPVGFVSVFIKGTNKGAITTEDGKFYIKNIKEGSYTLVASFIGLQAQEMPVAVTNNETSIADFTLPKNTQQLNEVMVTATRSKNKTPVTIGKIAISPLDMPQSMTIVNSQVIADQQASKLSDVIRNVNGVSLGSTRGTTSETFFARGYNLGANNIMKNGARVNSAAIPEASTLEKVEVLKGSAALLYGNVSGGAVINMVTKQPKFEYGGEVSLRAGSYNLFKPIGDVYGPITKNLAFRLVGTYETAESYRKSIESKKFYVNPSLLYKLGAKTEILVQADYLNHDLTPDFGIGSLNSKIPTSISRSSFFNTPWAYNKIEQRTASVNINHQLSNSWKLNVIGSNQLFKRDYFSTERIQADADGDWGRKLTRSKIAEDYYTGQVNLTGTFNTGSFNHQLLVGTDAERYLNTTNAFNIASLSKEGVYDSINILNPTKYVTRTDEPLATNTTRTEAPTYRFGYYAQDLISISNKVKVLAGLRWSYQKTVAAKTYDVATDAPTPNQTATDRFDRAFSPRIGIVYQPVSNTALFASYSNNFTPNTGRDIYNQNLAPSIIDQYEIGVKNDFFNDKLSANFTLYRIINNNLAQQAQYLADGTPNSDTNIRELTGQTTSDGAELDLNGNLTQGLNFLAGYSYNFMRYTKTSGKTGSYKEGERLVSNPAHTANATLFYTFSNETLKGLKVGLSGFYTGKRNGGWNNTVGWPEANGQLPGYSRLIPVSGFTTLDVSLGYSIKKFSILGKLSNITNELNYYVHENYSVNPIPPRQFITTVSYRF